MAKYSSVFKFIGKLGDLIFIGGAFPHIRKSDSSRSKMMKTDKRFKNTRLAQSDFGLASSLGKMIRNAIEPFTTQYKDTTISGRLTGTLFRVINQDTNPKGQRICDFKKYGDILHGFEFHAKNHLLQKHLLINYKVVREGIRFTPLQFHKKDVVGTPYLDIVILFVPEQVSTMPLSEGFMVHSDSFRIDGEVTVGVQVPAGKVGLVFVGLRFEDGPEVVFDGMRVIGVV